MNELLSEIRNLCRTYDVTFEVNSFGVVLRKMDYVNGELYKLSHIFETDLFGYKYEIEDIFMEFNILWNSEIEKVILNADGD